MTDAVNDSRSPANRRSFIKQGLGIAGVATAGTGLLASATSAFGDDPGEGKARLNKGDIAILRFLAAVDLIESDLWLQYAELGGTQDSELPGLTGGSAPYIAALQFLDGDMPQYIHDNTEDELTHAAFINAYLASKGAAKVSLDQFSHFAQ